MIDPEDDFLHWVRPQLFDPVEGEAVMTACGRIRPWPRPGLYADNTKPTCPTCADIHERSLA